MIIRAFLIGAFLGIATIAILLGALNGATILAVLCIVGLIAGVIKLFKGVKSPLITGDSISLFKWCKAYWKGRFEYTEDEKDFFGK